MLYLIINCHHKIQTNSKVYIFFRIILFTQKYINIILPAPLYSLQIYFEQSISLKINIMNNSPSRTIIMINKLFLLKNLPASLHFKWNILIQMKHSSLECIEAGRFYLVRKIILKMNVEEQEDLFRIQRNEKVYF